MHYGLVTVYSIQNLYKMNTSFSEHPLAGPFGVHYREVLLYSDIPYLDFCFTQGIIHDRTEE